MPHRSISFVHPVLFDYAAALTVLGDPRSPDSLTAALDTDPDLAIIVRPSLDYRLAIIWHTDPDRQPFWKTALRLTTRGQGHVLAAAAAASVAARELMVVVAQLREVRHRQCPATCPESTPGC
jgi:hypothetical protein